MNEYAGYIQQLPQDRLASSIFWRMKNLPLSDAGLLLLPRRLLFP
jgi:hypothetical protein